MFRKYGFCLLLWTSAVGALAQVQSGLYPYGSFDTVAIDSIDRGSLNVHFSIPVVTKQGRGLGFQYSLVYDSLVWAPMGTVGSQMWLPTVGFGLHGQLNEGFEGYLSYNSSMTKCFPSDGSPWYFVPVTGPYVYHDEFGVSHPFKYKYNYCTDVETGGGASPDGSGYSYSGGSVTAANGRQISVPANSQTASGTITDTNGNYISNNGNGTFTDTLGKTALTISGQGTPGSPRVFAYSTPNSTTPATVTVTYKAYQVQTNFGCAVGDYNLPQNLVDTITLADGSEYRFVYEQTPGYPANVTGRLAQLILPQSGMITYTYTGANNGIVCADGTPTGVTRTGGVNRKYVRSSITATTSHTAITDGLNNTSAYDFVIAGAPEAFYETNRSVNQVSGSTSVQLLSRQTCYNTSPNPCTTTAVALPITQIDTYETQNGGQQHGSTLTYDSFGLLRTRADYDFNAPRTSAPMRKETWLYPASGIVNLLKSDSVVDGSGNAIGSTTYLYDETAGSGHAALTTATPAPPHHNSVSSQRGNLTTVSQSAGTTTVVTTAGAYQDTGNPVSVSAPSNTTTFTGGATSYGYDGPTQTFPYTVTPPTPSSLVSLPSTATYDANSGALLTSVDPNSQPTTYASYDSRLRPTAIDYPDGGKATANYVPSGATITHSMNSTTHTTTQVSLNTWGQLLWVALYNDTGGYYWNNYCYDLNGNLQYTAYRFAAPNQNNNSCSGAGDSYTYDALGRVTKLTHGDNSFITYSYNGRDTQVTDENGVSRVIEVDGLGRPTKVCEISANTAAGASNCGLDITAASGFKTTYVYSTDTSAANALKVAVTQGAQTRIFETDWFGRPTSVTQPESGTTTYSYAYSTGAGLGLTVTRVRPQANQTGSTTTTTTTQYDVLGREVAVNYTDGLTPSRGWAYDVDNYWPQPSTNLKGRVAATGGGAGSTWNGSAYSYDAMGRVTSLWQCAPASCGQSNQAGRGLFFAYDQLGNLTQETDFASGAISYGRSVAGEVTSITNQTFTSLPQNPPSLVSNIVNGPNGPISYTQGNGLNVLLQYDQLGRLFGRFVCKGPATLSCSGGTQIYGTNGGGHGSQMAGQADTALNQQVNFGYDEVNRLTSRTVVAGTAQNYTYGYDRYGNRVSQTPLNGGYSFNPTINPANNHITTTGYAYDAAGNLTNDSVNAYTYDAEGNVIKVVNSGGTSQYVYDVFNHRVHVQTPSGTTEYTYDYAGRRISSWTSPPNSVGNEGRIYWGGQLLAYRADDGTTYFDHQDILGTERMRTTYSGTDGSTNVSLPWGDGYTAKVNTSAADQDNNHFAALEHDPESDTEHAQFRDYASPQGRWLAPDSYLGSYDLTNPQSFNRYAYVLNNPLSFVDPSGLDMVCDHDTVNGSLPCTTPLFSPGPPGPPITSPCSPDPTICGGTGRGDCKTKCVGIGGGGGGSGRKPKSPARKQCEKNALQHLQNTQAAVALNLFPNAETSAGEGLVVGAVGGCVAAGFVAGSYSEGVLFWPACRAAAPEAGLGGAALGAIGSFGHSVLDLGIAQLQYNSAINQCANE